MSVCASLERGEFGAVALLLDTRDVQPEARRDAVRDAYALADVPREVDLTNPSAAESTRIEGWMFGSMRLFCPDSPGIRVIRDSPTGHLEPMIALCVQSQGTGQSVEADHHQVLLPGELLMVGPTARNEFLVSGATVALEIPFDEVGITVELARKASTHLPSSPLFSLVSQHLLALHADADLIAQSATAAEVGAATAQLVKALIVSAALDERPARAALSDALAPRIFAYVRQHLTERDLTPVTIARAHNISVRYLYKLCDAQGVKLVDSIIAERLEGARRDLTTPHRTGGTIAQVSRKWGFKDPSHFSSRFRLAYGISPRDLQRQSRRDRERQVDAPEDVTDADY
jgi:AraC-like DNA-binding protein